MTKIATNPKLFKTDFLTSLLDKFLMYSSSFTDTSPWDDNFWVFSQRAKDFGASVVSLDLGINLLKQTRKKGLTHLIAGDITQLPFPNDYFEIVISSECIEHTPNPQKALRELARVLKPNGLLALTCPNKFWFWSCWIANHLNFRPYQGLENWPSWWCLKEWVRENGVTLLQHRGLHLFPFVLPITYPFLRWLDAMGKPLGPLYVNQCVLGKKK